MVKTKKQTILITGINGFLGRHISSFFSEKFEIIGLAYSSKNISTDIKTKVKRIYYSADGELEDVFKNDKIDIIIHTATVYQKINDTYERLIKTNILLPVQLLEFANKYNTKIFLNTDTFYNQTQSKYSYLSHYTLSKKQCVDWLNEIKGNCKLVNVKLFHVYGPNDRIEKFVPSLITTLIKDTQEIDLTGGKQKRDFIFVSDVVDAYACVLDSFQAGERIKTEYEVGSSHPISIRDFIVLSKKLTNSNTKLNFNILEYRANEIMHSKANNKELIKLGWKQKVGLEAGILNLIENLKNPK